MNNLPDIYLKRNTVKYLLINLGKVNSFNCESLLYHGTALVLNFLIVDAELGAASRAMVMR